MRQGLLDTEPHDRVTTFLYRVAMHDPEGALVACPFTWQASTNAPDGEKGAGFYVALRVRPAFLGQEIWASAKAAKLDDALRAVVLTIPDLAARFAKVEAAVEAARQADADHARDLEALPPALERAHINFLSGLARAELRKRLKALEKLAPHADQSPTAFAAARRKMRQKVEFIDTVLHVLRAMGAEPSPFLPDRGFTDHD